MGTELRGGVRRRGAGHQFPGASPIYKGCAQKADIWHKCLQGGGGAAGRPEVWGTATPPAGDPVPCPLGRRCWKQPRRVSLFALLPPLRAQRAGGMRSPRHRLGQLWLAESCGHLKGTGRRGRRRAGGGGGACG